MSIATLKKKTEHLYNNASVGRKSFSLNGTLRPQGYIGQTMRSFPRTLARGNTFRGYGGHYGQFNKGTNPTGILSGLVDYNNSKVIKSSVVSTSGMLESRFMWVRRPYPFSSTKPNSHLNNNSQGDYISNLTGGDTCGLGVVEDDVGVKGSFCHTLPTKYSQASYTNMDLMKNQCSIVKNVETPTERRFNCSSYNKKFKNQLHGNPLPN